jgi:Secretion system C-terminal sorting domain/PQQ-like domain
MHPLSSKLLLFSIAFFACVIQGNAQNPTVEWTNDFFTKKNSFGKLELDSKGNLMVFTAQETVTPTGGWSLQKFDTLGHLLWQTEYDELRILDIYHDTWVVDHSDQVYIAFNYGDAPVLPHYVTLVKYNDSGSKLWQMKLDSLSPGNNQYIADMEMDSLGRLIFLLRSTLQSNDTIYEGYMQVLCLDPVTQTVVWERQLEGYFGPRNLEITDVGIQYLYLYLHQGLGQIRHTIEVLDYDGNLMSSVDAREESNQSDYSTITKTGDVLFGSRSQKYRALCLNATADTAWVYIDTLAMPGTGAGVYSLVMDEEQNAYITGAQKDVGAASGTALTCKIGYDGQVLWKAKPDGDFDTLGNGALRVLVDSNYCYVIGQSAQSQNAQGEGRSMLFLAVIDRMTGEVLWEFEQSMGKDTVYRGYQGLASNGMLYILGYWYPYGNFQHLHQRLTCMRVPRIVSSVELAPERSVYVFPNPATICVHIEQIDLHLFQQVQLLGVDGRLINSQNFDASQVQINTSGLESGTYVIRLVGVGGQMTSKVVLH